MKILRVRLTANTAAAFSNSKYTVLQKATTFPRAMLVQDAYRMTVPDVALSGSRDRYFGSSMVQGYVPLNKSNNI
jgi:hypothetical protein